MANFSVGHAQKLMTRYDRDFEGRNSRLGGMKSAVWSAKASRESVAN